MMNFITYHLTKTVAGPSLKIINFEQGFNILMEWSEKYTIGTFRKISLQLTINEKEKVNLDILDEKFIRKPISSTIIDNKNKFNIIEWEIAPNRLKDLFEQINATPTFYESYEFKIIVITDFILLDKKGIPLSRQNLYKENQSSNLIVFINQNRISIEPRLYFPFENDDLQFKELYDFLIETFPFKLNEKNLFITTENIKSKYGYLTKKLR